jgi:hypothetical protein
MQLIYATLKRKVVSPVNMLVEHWLSFPNLIGDVSCTSLITQIDNDLGILGDATIITIDTPFEIIGYDYFRQARWVKKIQEKMHYIHNKSAIPLPNPGLGIHSVQSFLINEQAQLVQQQPPRTSARSSSSNYAGADHYPKLSHINHMKTSWQHTLVARTKEEIYHRKDRVWKWQVLRIIFEFCSYL